MRWILVFGGLVAAIAGMAAEPVRPDLRQTGTAEGHLERVDRETLCDVAEDAAWERVWASCKKRHSVVGAQADGCATTDYRPAGDDGKGPWVQVQVQVRYACR